MANPSLHEQYEQLCRAEADARARADAVGAFPNGTAGGTPAPVMTPAQEQALHDLQAATAAVRAFERQHPEFDGAGHGST